jgi:hypothetical protein
MRYVKPTCLSTVKAARTIQSGEDLLNKPNPHILDGVGAFSATSAYEADE